MTIRVRFAPSPTGFLHIGNARTALFNYLFARTVGGTFILRIEDTDKERSRKEFVTQIYEDLRWLGLSWDEGPDVGGACGPYVQSERTDFYRSHVERLMASGHAYYCYCSEEDLATRRKEQLAKGLSPRYDNRCRSLTAEDRARFDAQGIKPSIRFRMPNHKLVVRDIIRGDVEFDETLIGDFVIVRPDGTPTFHLAVCIDDGMMQITHVVRGEDHFSNTPRHVALFEAMGYPVPMFAHVPLIMGPGGEPLSKRLGAMSLAEYRSLGYLPHALANYMALLGWSSGNNEELFSWEELQKKFSLERVSKSAAVFDFAKLNWISGEQIRRLPDDEYVARAVQYIVDAELVERKLYNMRPEWYANVLLVFKDNISCFHDLEDRLKMFAEHLTIEQPDVLQLTSARGVLEELKKLLGDVELLDKAAFTGVVKELKKRVTVKGKELFLPLRVALTGREHGPELERVVVLLGKHACLTRLEKALMPNK